MNNIDKSVLDLFEKYVLPDLEIQSAEESFDGIPFYVSDMEEIKESFMCAAKVMLNQARSDELRRAKRQGYIAAPLIHKVDRRINQLEKERDKHDITIK